MTNEQELLEALLARVEKTYSTSEVADFLDRSLPWVYWIIGEEPEREDGGKILVANTGKKRRFTLLDIREIAAYQYRRGNYTDEEMEKVARRIAIAARGGDFRQVEGSLKRTTEETKDTVE